MMRTIALALIAFANVALADERILSFHSDIAVNADASMQVDETIRVHAEGNQIRHGIYRDFPTLYKDHYGNSVHVEFDPLTVTRDGRDEPFHTENQINGVRVYFGSADTTLDTGDYTYVFHYRTNRQLGFFDGFDELYWNVTGNGWDFPIDEASAAVTLPGSIDTAKLKVEGYTGEQGAKGRDYVASADAPSHATFRATRALAPREGLTIVVGFPKGIVAEPSAGTRTTWFLRDNGGILVGGIGLLLMWAYYLFEWLRVGRDPKAGVIIPEYEAPDGVTPGALRHVERMAYDDRCFAADLVDLAVRGHVDIRKDGGTYTLSRKSGGGGALPPPETKLLADLLGSRSTLELKQSEHSTISAAIRNHKETLKANDVGRYFHTNSKLVIPGALIALGSVLAGVFLHGAAPQLAGTGFMLVWLSGWSVGVFALVGGAISAWRSPPGIGAYASALFLTLFSLPFVAGEIAGIGMFAWFTGVGITIIAVLLVATNIAFFHWLKAPTLEGRKLLDRIAGLRLYLGVAERDTLAAQKAPPMTVDEFQRFLPYALALGVEKTWADKFAAAVGPAAAAAAAGAMGWYQSGRGYAGISDFTSGLGSSLSGAISSSSTAPGSSSGGGGGGSSGGGGGGGGGGGW
ncbi:MAG TPA: DUF2207 domain-containing protein [Rhodanobacteraceae bacterium]|nr:DUF2207 domain-containing protein [Rhodanobacteraceae bacterium]